MNDTVGLDKSCNNAEITPHLICITYLNDGTDPVTDNKFTQVKTDCFNGAVISVYTTYHWPG